MRRFVFQPRWVLGHLLVLAAAGACVWLGLWQWDRAHQTESLQNWGYAFQWPLFAVCFVLGWWRMLRLESRRLADAGDDGSETGSVAPVPVLDQPGAATPVRRPSDVGSRTDSATDKRAGDKRAGDKRAGDKGAQDKGAQDKVAEVERAEDERLAAYNRMLAALAARDKSDDR